MFLIGTSTATMNIQFDSVRKYSSSLKITAFLLLAMVNSASSMTTKCPFSRIFLLGDGFSDIGTSANVVPGLSIPSTRFPYGITFPGTPNGRWSDGRVSTEFVAQDFELPDIRPYFPANNSLRNNGVIFAVARSPVLDLEFFRSRGVDFPPYAVPLKVQLQWIRSYLNSVCSNSTDCSAKILQDSLVILGYEDGNDIGYPLSQGKSIEEVKAFVPLIRNTIIDAARELIKMGATRVVITGSNPLGCFPYILTALDNSSLAAYDPLGCLKSVNNLIISKNNDLNLAVTRLSLEFLNATILFADLYTPLQTIISTTALLGTNPLKACCGIGGRYNFDENRFCASPGVPFCANPNRYIFWDGLHLTQETFDRITSVVLPVFRPLLKCRLI
ncbi:acetylajmalan esterase-like [Andrographis paniculata]|uniref:acetylajmalan esterase-like n=1 Tax=Andrographis paniculata TaxID=175694 RepID=UPI0021E99428|nr:acetylajmalan esterase-like [Andrographis paniculata]